MQEKSKDKSQWNERAGRPIATKYMEKSEILYFRRVLAQSYSCPEEDISYNFEKITDENDSDRDDCLLLTYRMDKCIVNNEVKKRIIYRIKVPVPDGIKERANESSNRFFNIKTIAPPEYSTNCNNTPQGPPQEPPTGAVSRPQFHRAQIKQPVKRPIGTIKKLGK
jgi:hypothetical protein